MSQAKPDVESWQDQTKRQKRGVPEGLWQQCSGCSATVYRRSVEENQYVCPQCDHHFIVPGKVRVQQLLDSDSFEEWYTNLQPCDPLGFVDKKPYAERLVAEQKRTGLRTDRFELHHGKHGFGRR
jgi:acetyl-CoA carboxylase carboxyl transferase subunit beta